jgi:hypothetical protein
MSHIYQPLLIRTLLKSGGHAEIRDIAREFLAHDESQIDYYEHIAKVMPMPVLWRHGIVEKRGKEVFLRAELTPGDQAELIAACDAKIDSHKAQRGAAIWQHRDYGLGAVPGSVRYLVLKRAKFRCELCGIPASERDANRDGVAVNRGCQAGPSRSRISKIALISLGGQGVNRTLDTRIFSPLLYRLSYLPTATAARIRGRSERSFVSSRSVPCNRTKKLRLFQISAFLEMRESAEPADFAAPT